MYSGVCMCRGSDRSNLMYRSLALVIKRGQPVLGRSRVDRWLSQWDQIESRACGSCLDHIEICDADDNYSRGSKQPIALFRLLFIWVECASFASHSPTKTLHFYCLGSTVALTFSQLRNLQKKAQGSQLDTVGIFGIKIQRLSDIWDLLTFGMTLKFMFKMYYKILKSYESIRFLLQTAQDFVSFACLFVSVVCRSDLYNLRDRRMFQPPTMKIVINI